MADTLAERSNTNRPGVLDLEPLNPRLDVFLALEQPGVVLPRGGEGIKLLVVGHPGVNRWMPFNGDLGRPFALLLSHHKADPEAKWLRDTIGRL